MLLQLFFYTDSGLDKLRTPEFRAIANWHANGGSELFDSEHKHFGVAHPHPKVDPHEVAQFLERIGFIVLPGIHDTDTPVHSDVHKALAHHAVVPEDHTRHIAKKMHAATGNPLLKPNLF